MAEGFALHVNKGYVYFAMAFGLILELCHIQLKKKQKMQVRRIRSLRVETNIA
jgi:predicted tellurium resistance membrane protein TerC